MRPRTLVAIAAVIGAGLTAAVTLLPNVRFAYENPELHVAIETAAVLIGFLGALLVFGRFRESGSTRDLIIVYVLLILAFTNLFFATAPTLFDAESGEVFLAWTQSTARVVAGTILVVGAFARPGVLRRRRLGGASVAAAAFATLLVIGAIGGIATPFLPDPLGETVTFDDGFRPRIVGHPVFLGQQLLQMALFGVAAIGYLRAAERDPTPIMSWLAAGCMLSAFARLNYFLFPSRYTDFVYIGDVLRLGFYACLLIGGIREIAYYWQAVANATVGETRRALARDLHDGLAQELVFITAQSQRLMKGKAEQQELQRLASAADRAVAESRRAINILSTGREQSLRDALEELGEEASRRVGMKVKLSLEDVVTAPATREAVIRMTREALMNAIRHSAPTRVEIELRDSDGALVVVSDDGIGFDPDDAGTRKRGFGLVSLEERAKALGGRCTITSRAGQGSEVTIHVPRGDVAQKGGETGH